MLYFMNYSFKVIFDWLDWMDDMGDIDIFYGFFLKFVK